MREKKHGAWNRITESILHFTFLKCQRADNLLYDLLLAGEYQNTDKRGDVVPNVICVK